MKSIVLPPFSAEKSRTYLDLFREPRFQVALVAFLAIVMYFSKMGGTGLATWDDCYYAQKAKEIVQTGDWVTMHYNGTPSFDNPPFYMWATVLSYKVFGVSEFAAKFPSALMGVLTVVLTYLFVTYLFDHWLGLFAAVILATTTVFAKYARHAMFDVMLTFFVLLALFGLVLAMDGRKRYLLLWAVGIGVSVLLKSFLGLFPLFIGVVVLAATGNVRLIFSRWFLLAMLVVVALGGSWYFHQYFAHGQRFIDVHFIWLLFHRGLGQESQAWHHHLSYLKDFGVYYWPWLPFALYGFVILAKRAWRRDKYAVLLVVWIVSYIVVMSVMKSRKFWYIMPVFVPTAVAAAVALDALIPAAKRHAVRHVVAKLVVAATAALFLVANLTPLKFDRERNTDVRIIAPYVSYFCERDATVISYRYTFWYLNNPLLFYSDCSANPVTTDLAEIEEAFVVPDTVLCVTDWAGVAEMKERLDDVHIVKEGVTMVLLSNRSLDATAVK